VQVETAATISPAGIRLTTCPYSYCMVIALLGCRTLAVLQLILDGDTKILTDQHVGEGCGRKANLAG